MPHSISWSPSLDDGIVGARLAELLRPGEISDRDLASRSRRLGDRFRTFLCRSAPGPGRGVVMTPELRGETEKYLPVAEIAAALRRLIRLSFDPAVPPCRFPEAESWFELLEAFPPLPPADPAWWLRQLSADPEFRTRFLFRLALPRRHGESFGRYPKQLALLRGWLREREPERETSCLDAACGTGEGSWELASLLLESGRTPGTFRVRGESLGLLEVFAAAHALFPHDPRRQEDYRRTVAPLFGSGAAARVAFAVGDLASPPESSAGFFDVILCNGILGGPFLNEEGPLRTAVEDLAARLAPGGILLAADSFHDGWKRKVPPERIAALFAETGLTASATAAGVAASRR